MALLRKIFVEPKRWVRRILFERPGKALLSHSRILKIKRSVAVVVLLFLSLQTQDIHAQSREYLVKAAFLYNFAKFVEWPDEAFSGQNSPLFLCILGDDPFGKALDTLKGKTVMGRNIVIKRYRRLEDISGCNIVFISPSERERLPSILKTLEDRNVLTVSDMDGFAREGGIIGLVTVENKIRFEINVDAAERSHLRISSKLLRLSSIVSDAEERMGNN